MSTAAFEITGISIDCSDIIFSGADKKIKAPRH